MSTFEYVSVSESIIAAFGRVERTEDLLPVQFFLERTSELSRVSDEELEKVLEAFDLEIQSFYSEIDSEQSTLDAMDDLYAKIHARNLGVFEPCEVLQVAVNKFETPGQQRVLLELCRAKRTYYSSPNGEELMEFLSSSLKEAA